MVYRGFSLQRWYICGILKIDEATEGWERSKGKRNGGWGTSMCKGWAINKQDDTATT